MKKPLLSLCVLVVLGFCFPSLSWGQTAVEQSVKQSAALLEAGKVDAAIVELEAAADRGELAQSLSFNRGLAYARRAESAKIKSGDLGQAAAAFAEVLFYDAIDAQARSALESLQIEVATREARSGSKNNEQTETFGLVERFLLWLSPAALFSLGAFGSALLCCGIFLRRSQKEKRALVGSILLGLGLLLLLPSAALSQGRAWLFDGAKAAVVVAPRAQLVDESGRSIKGLRPLNEASLLYLGTAKHGLYPIVSVGQKAWISMAQVRIVSHSAL